MGPRRIQPDPLNGYTVTESIISYQVGSSTGPTTSGRAHNTFSTSLFYTLDEAADEDVDMELPDLMEDNLEDSNSEEDSEATPPSVKVVAHKVPAKRYTNSVSAEIS